MGYIKDECGDTLYETIIDISINEISIAYARIAYLIKSNTLSDASKIALINAYIEQSKMRSPLWRKNNSKVR